MIRCGLALDVDEIWKIEQLFQEWQSIVVEHGAYFNGELVPPYVHAFKWLKLYVEQFATSILYKG